MKRELKPLFSKIVVKPSEAPAELNGLILPDEVAQRMRPQEGLVLAIGPDVTQVAVGDIVTFSKYDGHQMELDEELLRICDEKDIYALVLSA